MSYINLKNVSKKYTLISKKGAQKDFYALKNISLSIKKGETVGIIGSNGSGKTTLLKIIAGIIKPSSGSISSKGSIFSFIDLGSGLQDELTGKENVFLYGSMLGINKSILEKKIDQIFEFSQLQAFANMKFKNYSNGMKLRLIFAIAMSHESEILLLDEIVSVGDEEFSRRSISRIKSLKSKDGIIVLVSHDINLMKYLCDKLIVLDKGMILKADVPERAAKYYLFHSIINSDSNDDLNLKELSTKYFLIKKEISGAQEKIGQNRFSLLNGFRQSKIKKLEESREQVLSDMDDIMKQNYERSHLLLLNIDGYFHDEDISIEEKKILSKMLEKNRNLLRAAKKINELDISMIGLLSKLVFQVEMKLEKDIASNSGFLKEVINIFEEEIFSAGETNRKQLLESFLSFMTSLDIYKFDNATISYCLYETAKILGAFKGTKSYGSEIIYIHRIYLASIEQGQKIFKSKLRLCSEHDKTKYLAKIGQLEIIKQELSKHFNVEKTDKNPVIKINGMQLLDNSNSQKEIFECGETFKIRLDYLCKFNFGISFEINIFKEDGTLISSQNSGDYFPALPLPHEEGKVYYILEENVLLPGAYYVQGIVCLGSGQKAARCGSKKYFFSIASHPGNNMGIIKLKARWSKDA